MMSNNDYNPEGGSLSARVWKAFCGELTQPPTEDMAQALSTALQKIVEEKEVYVFSETFGDSMFVLCEDIRQVAKELDS